MDLTERIQSVLFGVAVGDALGVPVEFQAREFLQQHPVTDMIGHGTHDVPAGTFSDDSSMTFCLAETLTQDFDLDTIAKNFVNWHTNNFWTATGSVFDIGGTTLYAINRLKSGIRPDLAGGFDGNSNGNGSLMRILPLVFYLADKEPSERYEITKQVSSITHGHLQSVIACYYYLEFAGQLLERKDKFEIYKGLKELSVKLALFTQNSVAINFFDRLLKGNIYELAEEEIKSSGYVLDTLEASIWCLFTTDHFEEAVLKAVNLGLDTDTTAAVTGGLAGLLYGYQNIPVKWINKLARHDDIDNLAQRLSEKIISRIDTGLGQ